MNIDEFRAELETRLSIEKEYLTQEACSVDEPERLELLGKFNGKYKELIKRLADENGIDLNESYPSENASDSENLSYGQIILGRTMNVYDRLSDELYEEITNI
ncbi:hypothetical protein CLU97_4641 [Chryseobacterium sp. 7]|uniref:hypothetical protein n=1 Tax=Chryseobacterium sp. 7 TaxID=2035214 RepID=UPI000EB5D22F|nr:hypothetical protein [Chryseobacterium sp. 7]RLJ23063.1 hypothetical protein CLU97_4641 [Chryseobacterium sp. 7]